MIEVMYLIKMSSRVISSLALLLSLLVSCSEEEPKTDPLVSNLPAVSAISVQDNNNLGNSADIRVRFVLNGDFDELTSLKLVVAKRNDVPEEEEIILSDQFIELDVSYDFDFQMEAMLNDIDGDPIIEEIQYSFYLLLISSEETSVRLLSQLTITNEIIVTTPQINGNTTIGEDIIVGEDNVVYVCALGNRTGTVSKIENEEHVSLLTNQVQGAWQIVFDTNGDLLVGGDNQYAVTLDGETKILNTLNGSSAYDNDGYMYVVDYVSDGSTIYKVSPGGETEEWLYDSRLDGPVNIHYDQERDRFYVTNWDAGSILMIDKNKNIQTLINTEHSFGHSTYQNDRFFVTSYFGHVVLEISLDGEIINTIGNYEAGNIDGNASSASFNLPNGIGINPDGSALYVSCFGGPLRKVVLQGPRDN